MNYYISHLHLFYKNVTRDGKDFDNRPFENLEEMYSLVKGNHDTIKDLRYKQLYDEICDYKEMRDTFS